MAHATTATIRADDPIFAIDVATRAGMHLLIQLYGPSQCGKTVTGLMVELQLADRDRELRGSAGDNDTAQLNAIITDVAQMRFRYLENPDRVDPMTFGRLVAQEVIQRMDSADIVGVSRFTRGG